MRTQTRTVKTKARRTSTRRQRDREFREWMRVAIDSFLPPEISVSKKGLDEFMGIIDARTESEIEARQARG